MVVLLHGDYPRDIVEGHGAEAEVGVVGDFAHLLHEAIQVGGGNAVDGCDEVGRGKAVVV